MKAAIAGAVTIAALSAAVVASPFPEPFDNGYADLHLVPSRIKRQGGGTAAPSPPASLPIATGLSDKVPGPKANGGKAWKASFARAAAMVEQMTLEEKVIVITGQVGRCEGNSGAVPRLGLPSLCLQDGPAGPRPATGKTQFPAGVTTAATWDLDLMYQRSLAMGQEFYDLGINVALAPVTGGPLGRAARNGRNWEGWAADPYLTGAGAYQSVKGLTDAGMLCTAKHFLLYEQETFRNSYGGTASYSVFPASAQLPIDSYASSKTTHELYAWPFAEAVRAGTSYVMSSYNMVNGTHASANSETLNGLLKTEFNFQGAVMSDWGAVWDTRATLVGGTDWDMPGFGAGGTLGIFFGPELVTLVQNGTVPESRVDEAITRVLTPYFQLGLADKTLPTTSIAQAGSVGFPSFYRLVQKQSTLDLIKKIGEDGAILLKNVNGALPLDAPRRIAVIGQDAGPNVLGTTAGGEFGNNYPMDNNNGTFSLGKGSGYSLPQNLITPLCSIQDRATKDRSFVEQVLNNTAIDDIEMAAANADVALVFVDAFAEEFQDREDLLLGANGDAIIIATASNNNNTILIMHIPGTVNIEQWKNHPNITAILAPLLPGEQAGPSLVSVLYGDVSPSGKLPFTIGKSEADFPPNGIVSTPVVAPKSYFTEGLEIDYRWIDAHNITPTYEFGFGLSYSTFAYSNIHLESSYEADKYAIQETNEVYLGQESGSIYDQILLVSADVKNTGDVVACEVAQLYVEFPASENEPPRQLRGFNKLKQMKAGSTQTADFPIRHKDVMVWDTVLQKWRLPTDGYITFHVGASSRNLPLNVKHTF